MKTTLSKTKPSTVNELNSRQHKIVSSTGGWIAGKGVFSHGYSMMDELVGKKSYMQIVVLNATGKLVDKNLADCIESGYSCLSWPDPRIWCNQIGALAGETRATVVAGTVAGLLANDSKAYGAKTMVSGMEFIQSSLVAYQAGQSVAEIIENATKIKGGKPNITGYARPLAKGDERVEAMERVIKEKGFEVGAHLNLAYQIEAFLQEHYEEGININGYVSAFLSDQGFTPQETYQIYSALVFSGVTACYVETYNKPVNSFLPLRCDDIAYTGAEKREIPEHRD